MKALLNVIRYSIVAVVLGGVLGVVGAVGAYFYLAPTLPSIDVLKDVRLRVPLRVHAAGGELIAEFGEMKRTPLSYDQIPDLMVKAVLAAEDDRFFEHPGVDYQGLLRAAYYLLRTGEKGQGGSTITMQVARNFFLSREKTYLRKVSEIFLAIKIEQELTKQEILELYLNKIYLGNRAYGAGSAAQVYYGQELHELDLARFAMIAGLPKAPSRYNPIINPERALARRNYVLRRMRELGFIEAGPYIEAKSAPVTATLHTLTVEVEAPYVAEMVRAEMYDRFGEEAYTEGYRVYTTVDARLQQAANASLKKALLDYDVRHGYRGPLKTVELDRNVSPEQWVRQVSDLPEVGDLIPALVFALEDQVAYAYTARDEPIRIEWDGLSWARRYVDENSLGPEPEVAADILQVGDVVYVQQQDDQWRLGQVPEVSGALVSLNPTDGSVLSLVGGFDYFQSKFNRVTHGRRQPGSNFKPFVYSAALENGFTTASVINDAPVVFEDDKLESVWRPENYSGRFFGPTRLREALVKSRNLVSIRLLRAIGVGAAIRHVSRFGFDPAQLPRDLSLALGSAGVTPLELARGYAVFANGGYLVEAHVIRRIEDRDGNIIFEADVPVVCPDCSAEQTPATEDAPIEPAPDLTKAELPPVDGASGMIEREPAPLPVEPPKPKRLAERVVDEENIYLVTTMMQDVIRRGTGRRALRLGRGDLAGKTGTTNEQRDAWFSGFNQDVVTTVWVGFDTPHPLGNRETGARAALPMWVDYMETALAGRPENAMEQPPGLVMAKIDPETGEFARSDSPDAIFEFFRARNVPKQPVRASAGDEIAGGNSGEEGGSNLTQQLF